MLKLCVPLETVIKHDFFPTLIKKKVIIILTVFIKV